MRLARPCMDHRDQPDRALQAYGPIRTVAGRQATQVHEHGCRIEDPHDQGFAHLHAGACSGGSLMTRTHTGGCHVSDEELAAAPIMYVNGRGDDFASAPTLTSHL